MTEINLEDLNRLENRTPSSWSGAERSGVIALARRALEQPAPTNCSGKWLSGSGGHRVFGGCSRAATWVELAGGAAACDGHLAEHVRQPVPTGEVTRGHRETLLALAKESGDFVVEPERLEAWLNHAVGAPIDCYAELSLESAAELLATREQAAYQRGRQEAQGGWGAGYQAGVAHALQRIRDWGWMSGYLCDAAARNLASSPPPSDTAPEAAKPAGRRDKPDWVKLGAYVRKRHSQGEPMRVTNYDTLHEWVEVAGGARIDWADLELVEPASPPSPAEPLCDCGHSKDKHHEHEVDGYCDACSCTRYQEPASPPSPAKQDTAWVSTQTSSPSFVARSSPPAQAEPVVSGRLVWPGGTEGVICIVPRHRVAELGGPRAATAEDLDEYGWIPKPRPLPHPHTLIGQTLRIVGRRDHVSDVWEVEVVEPPAAPGTPLAATACGCGAFRVDGSPCGECGAGPTPAYAVLIAALREGSDGSSPELRNFARYVADELERAQKGGR